MHDFPAAVTLTLAHQINNSSGVLTVHHDYVLQPRTTRFPSYLELDPPSSLLSDLSDLGSDSISGVAYSRIWPESPSFSDRDLGPIPKKWSGECEIGELIGARYFAAGYSAAFGLYNGEETEFLSARDSDDLHRRRLFGF